MNVEFKNNKGFCVWLTGLTCAGKTTLAKGLYQFLKEKGLKVKLYDGDEMRKTISKDLGFSKEDRIENMRRVALRALEDVKNGYIVIVALVSPYKEARESIRKMFENGSFIEVFVDAPLEVCMKRDTKGLYQKALAGLIRNFTGVDDPYEPSENPEVYINTAESTPEENMRKMIEYFVDRKRIL
jgi:adenylyl-sulfate kinase